MEDKKLIEMAFNARKNAYAPYSNFAVGAAIETESNKIYTGCNIENAAYSPTNCAERTAIFKAVSEGERKIIKVAIVAGAKELAQPLPAIVSPCGVCRQVLAEFGDANMVILLAKSQDDYIKTTLGELFPMSFSSKDL